MRFISKLTISRQCPVVGKRILFTLALAASMVVVPSAPASAGVDDFGTCRVVHSGKSGPRGDYVVVHRRNRFSFAGATVLYRDHHRIRFFTSQGIPRSEGWRSRAREIRCGRVTVRDIDRIVIKMKAKERRALVIDQSGRGLKAGPHQRARFRGPGGPFSPGASGRGIRVEFANRPRRSAYLVYAGSDRSDRVYLSRQSGLTSIRTRSAAGKPLGSLVGFNASKIAVKMNGGDDRMDAGGLGPDPSDYGDFYFQVWGGRGDDRLLGHEGRDLQIKGGPGDDLIRGRRGDDRDTGNGFGLKGGTGDDLIFGGPGGDDIEGNAGQDEVWPGPGNDSVNMRDRQADVINCEFGSVDQVIFDRTLDELIDCLDG